MRKIRRYDAIERATAAQIERSPGATRAQVKLIEKWLASPEHAELVQRQEAIVKAARARKNRA